MKLKMRLRPVATVIVLPDPDSPFYLVDGRPVDRWHTKAEKAGLLPNLPQPGEPGYDNVVNAKHRGRQVGQAVEFLLKREPFDFSELHDEALPYVMAFIDCIKQVHMPGPWPSGVEMPVYNAELGYVVKPDWHYPAHPYELKTPHDADRTWGLQEMAQEMALGAADGTIIWLRPKLKTRKYEIHQRSQPWQRRRNGTSLIFSDLDRAVVEAACQLTAHCSQCGARFCDEACGPTHAALYAETQEPIQRWRSGE